MIFKRKKSPANSKRRYFVEFDLEELPSSSKQLWEMPEDDLEIPPKLILEIFDIEALCTPSVSYEMADLRFPVVNFNLNELIEIENQWKSKRKKFDFDFESYLQFSFHGTSSMQNVKSIIKEGWKVGSGNAYGSGIYFGFAPGSRNKNKNQGKSKIPVPGLSYKSGTIADSFAGYSGALIIAEVDWGNFANWENQKVQEKYYNWCSKGKNKYGGGDAITEWCLSNGYDSVKCPKGGFGVMLQHRYSITKKFWKTDKIRICYVYSLRDKKVEKLK
ncbi:MAG: hypothetical protein JSV88_21405 [Candidatus Aminicenantes bacterium]|nr:MAG: hypothetical protein JSV88_21405 [Candidatus Aminicenantes bacterium]